jgi:predicted transcriptional regulator
MADYSKPAKLKEGYDQDPEINELLNTVYENLSDDNKKVFNDILENSPDQMIEFLEQLEVQNG